MPMDNTGGLNTSCASAPHVSQPNFYGYSTPSLVLSEFSQPQTRTFNFEHKHKIRWALSTIFKSILFMTVGNCWEKGIVLEGGVPWKFDSSVFGKKENHF